MKVVHSRGFSDGAEWFRCVYIQRTVVRDKLSLFSAPSRRASARLLRYCATRHRHRAPPELTPFSDPMAVQLCQALLN